MLKNVSIFRGSRTASIALVAAMMSLVAVGVPPAAHADFTDSEIYKAAAAALPHGQCPVGGGPIDASCSERLSATSQGAPAASTADAKAAFLEEIRRLAGSEAECPIDGGPVDPACADRVILALGNTYGAEADALDAAADSATLPVDHAEVPAGTGVPDMLDNGVPCGLSGYYTSAGSYYRVYNYKIRNCHSYAVSRKVVVNNSNDGDCHKAIGPSRIVSGSVFVPVWGSVSGLKAC